MKMLIISIFYLINCHSEHHLLQYTRLSTKQNFQTYVNIVQKMWLAQKYIYILMSLFLNEFLLYIQYSYWWFLLYNGNVRVFWNIFFIFVINCIDKSCKNLITATSLAKLYNISQIKSQFIKTRHRIFLLERSLNSNLSVSMFIDIFVPYKKENS